jgi:hypothetical protein
MVKSEQGNFQPATQNFERQGELLFRRLGLVAGLMFLFSFFDGGGCFGRLWDFFHSRSRGDRRIFVWGA